MKKFFLASAALVVLASPAFAAGHQQHAARYHQSAQDAYARQGYVTRDPDTVYENGTYAGRDPDPFIRLQLLREAEHGED